MLRPRPPPWNLAEPGVAALAKSVTFTFQGVKSSAAVSIGRVDKTHGDVLASYDKMGAPIYPSQEQLRQLRDVERPEPPQVEHLTVGLSRWKSLRRDWRWLR